MTRAAARTAYLSGDFHTAVRIVEKDLRTAPPGTSTAILRCDLARYLYLVGRSTAAKEHLRAAATLARGGHDEADATWLATTGWLHLHHLEFAPAIGAATAALELARALKLPEIEADTLGQIAALEVVQIGAEQGLARAREAVAAARAVDDLDLVAEVYINVAGSLEATGDEAGAIAYLEGVLPIVDAFPAPTLAVHFLKLALAQLLTHAGRIDDAVRIVGGIDPARVNGVTRILFRLTQAEIAAKVGNLSAAMLWIDELDISGWAYSDQWHTQLDELLKVVAEGFDRHRDD